MPLPRSQSTHEPLVTEDTLLTVLGRALNMQRWIWLEVALPSHTKTPPSIPTFNRHYVPEAIIRHIPSYQATSQVRPTFEELCVGR
jgi:hypothetical protein